MLRINLVIVMISCVPPVPPAATVAAAHTREVGTDMSEASLPLASGLVGRNLAFKHDNPGHYFISHGSLAKRGLSIGQASAYQMLSPEHMLYLPLSFLQL
jgi:hypothetical protein